jgi:FkbM family methyltransferase
LRDRSIVRRLPKDFGSAPIYSSAAGGLKFLMRPIATADPILLATARALVRPGDTVWDIGANIGIFAVAAAALTGSKGGLVVAFEPDAALVQLLRRTAARQPKASAEIRVVPAAVAASTGIRTFHIAVRARAANALDGYGGSQMGGVRERQTVVAFSVEDCLRWLPAPSALKIDVEGAEAEILTNAGALLSSVRPLIACEVAPQNQATITAALLAARYRLFDAEGLARGVAQECDRATWNTIAIPQERTDFDFERALGLTR